MDLFFDYEKEKQKFEQEKLEFKRIQKEHESRLQHESNLLINLQESILNNHLKLKEKNINDDNDKNELESLKLLYEIKLQDLSSQINLLQEDEKLFNNYKDKYILSLNNHLEELKKQNIEQTKKKQEISEKIQDLEKKEKEIIDKVSKKENEKKMLTEFYNKSINKENENKDRAMVIDTQVKEFDRKKEQNEDIKKQLITKIQELKIAKENIDKKKQKLKMEKNNLLLKLESIDIIGMNYIGGNNNKEKENNWKTQREKFFYGTFSNNFINPLEKNFSSSKTESNFFNNKFNKTSIIN